jgi:hypothetical protein
MLLGGSTGASADVSASADVCGGSGVETGGSGADEGELGGGLGVATGGGMTLRDRVAPHSASEAPFGQQPALVQ